LIPQSRSVVLDGCPMFAKAYMGRGRILPMLSLHAQGLSLLAAVFSPHSKSVGKGLRPVFFGPCTLGRTWGTRPGKRASFFAPTAATPMNSTKVATQPDFRPSGRRISSPNKSIPERLPHHLIWTVLGTGRPRGTNGKGKNRGVPQVSILRPGIPATDFDWKRRSPFILARDDAWMHPCPHAL
jgi:hypothetical protein